MPIVGGLDIHRKQLTFDYLDTVTGEVRRGQIAPADREHLRGWLARFAGRDDVAFAMEGCTGWRYVAEGLAAAGLAVHVGEPADTAAARGRKRHAKTDKTDSAHLRTLLAEGRLPECWIPPTQILEYRALLETYHDLRREHTAWVNGDCPTSAAEAAQTSPATHQTEQDLLANSCRAPATGRGRSNISAPLKIPHPRLGRPCRGRSRDIGQRPRIPAGPSRGSPRRPMGSAVVVHVRAAGR
jgi:hypothetical protein